MVRAHNGKPDPLAIPTESIVVIYYPDNPDSIMYILESSQLLSKL